ncbi:DUF3298 and DUF4163 domain-containing protein [Thermosipho affectus]|uniref:DUF3298 and DUF4163 domain-containing protein n=1 Tax=Thermosipho affectus TaxID=660294 RepID=UPI00098102CA|nr:DUF3298 and DUF4163 domain-containing protein [Thermosipho affectus]
MKKLVILLLIFQTLFLFSIQYVEFSSTLDNEIWRLNVKYPMFFDVENFAVEKYINDMIYNDIYNYIRNLYDFLNYSYHDAKKYDIQYRPGNVVVNYKVTYLKDNIISLVIDYYEYTGGAHGNTKRKAYNFDITKGKLLKLHDVVTRDSIEKMLKYINNQIKLDKKRYFQTLLDELPSEQFYFTNKGLVVYFNQYEIAPYSSGIPEFTFKLEDIQLKK